MSDENTNKSNVPRRGRGRGRGKGKGRGRGRGKVSKAKIVKPTKRRQYSVASDVSENDAAVTNLRRSRRVRRQEPVASTVDSTDLGESEDSELEELLKEAVDLNKSSNVEINEADLHRNIDELLEMDSD